MSTKLKSLFFTSDEPQVSVSDSNTTVSSTVIPAQNIQNTLQLYEQEFDKLNLQGPDFFEFLKAISKIPDADAKTYQVIQATLDLDKRSLLDNAKFYVDKLNEICVGNKASINGKIEETTKLAEEETAESRQQVQLLDNQIQVLQKQRDATAATVKSAIDKLTVVQLELNNQLKANDLAKSTIVDRINVVVEGIKSNLK